METERCYRAERFREQWSMGWRVVDVDSGKTIVAFDGSSYILNDEGVAKDVADQLNWNQPCQKS